MTVELTAPEREHLRQLQKRRRDEAGYVKVTVVLMLDAGWGAGQVTQALGLDDGTVYRYAQAWQRLGLEKYLAHEAAGYWGLLPSAGLAALSREWRKRSTPMCGLLARGCGTTGASPTPSRA